MVIVIVSVSTKQCFKIRYYKYWPHESKLTTELRSVNNGVEFHFYLKHCMDTL